MSLKQERNLQFWKRLDSFFCCVYTYASAAIYLSFAFFVTLESLHLSPLLGRIPMAIPLSFWQHWRLFRLLLAVSCISLFLSIILKKSGCISPSPLL